MPDIVGILNSFCPRDGRNVSTLVLYDDGSMRLFGRRDLALANVQRLLIPNLPEDESGLAPIVGPAPTPKRPRGRPRKLPG